MKVTVKDYCIRCGICAGLYPEMFAHNFKDDCIDVLKDADTPEEIEMAKNAARDCAVAAIAVTKD